MGSRLPFLSETYFCQRLLKTSSLGCSNSSLAALYLHYSELRRWNSKLSLVGPGTADEIVERHYGESLAALPLIEPGDRNLIDIGTGGGFPGFVLAAALPSLRVTLTEPRERKWAFLKITAERCGLSVRCLDVRIQAPLPRELPREFDVVTCRAVSLPTKLLEAFFEESPRVRILLWSGASSPELPDACRIRRKVPLAPSDRRQILEIVAR